MFQAQNRETINSIPVFEKLLRPSDHYDDEHNNIVFYNTTSDPQDQDHSVQDQGQKQDRLFGLRPFLLALRPTVSDHITGAYCNTIAEKPWRKKTLDLRQLCVCIHVQGTIQVKLRTIGCIVLGSPCVRQSGDQVHLWPVRHGCLTIEVWRLFRLQ